MNNLFDLNYKHLIITGGSSGIGRQCAIQASTLGANVSLIARNGAELEETMSLMDSSSKHAAYSADLSDVDSIDGLIRAIILERGPCDGLCHAAGTGDGRLARQSKPAYVQKMFALHTFAFIEIVRCLLQKRYLNDGASLVGVSSVAAERGNVSQGVYGAAKAAMNSFVKPASIELAKRSIRINTVAFAMVNTPMYQKWVEETGGNSDLESRQALGLIDVESAANAIMFMLSDASSSITGITLPVYAGY